VYQKILQTVENDSESQFALALIYLQQKNEQDARVYLKKLVNKRGWGAQASFYLGRIAFNNAEYETALTWFDKVTEGPYKYEASMAAVSVLLEQDKFVDAETRLATLDDKFPQKKVDILLLKAEAFTKQQKYQQAFDVLSTGLDIFPEQRDLLYSRALIAEKIGGLPLLERDLKVLLLKYPNDVAALNALGYTLVDRTERYAEAEVYLQKAIELSPDNALIMDSMGWLRFKQGRLEDALLLLRVAYDKQAENEIAIHLAEVLHKLDANREAADIINKALEKTPKDEYLLKFRERFPEIR
ncbi:MAG: tetratricopeptide repeat protein, partial [Methylococcales bacterium]